MEHGVVMQPCVPVGFKYTLVHKRGIGLFVEAKVRLPHR